MIDSQVFDDSLKELLKRLDEIPGKIEANIVRGALRVAMKPIYEAAKESAPIGTGMLQESVRISSAIKNKWANDGEGWVRNDTKGTVTVQVKAGGKTKDGYAFHAYLVERGTNPHGKHPGTPARPFMKTAFNEHSDEFVRLYSDYMRKRIPKELGKRGIS